MILMHSGTLVNLKPGSYFLANDTGYKNPTMSVGDNNNVALLVESIGYDRHNNARLWLGLVKGMQVLVWEDATVGVK